MDELRELGERLEWYIRAEVDGVHEGESVVREWAALDPSEEYVDGNDEENGTVYQFVLTPNSREWVGNVARRTRSAGLFEGESESS